MMRKLDKELRTMRVETIITQFEKDSTNINTTKAIARR